MTGWLLENREWLSLAAPFNAVIIALLFWLIVDQAKSKVKHISEADKSAIMTFAAGKREDFENLKEEIKKFRASRRILSSFKMK